MNWINLWCSRSQSVDLRPAQEVRMQPTSSGSHSEWELLQHWCCLLPKGCLCGLGRTCTPKMNTAFFATLNFRADEAAFGLGAGATGLAAIGLAVGLGPCCPRPA